MIDGLTEVILYVEDMNRAVEFYRDTLGLDVSHPEGTDDFEGLDWVTFDTGGCRLALHSGGKDGTVEGDADIVFAVDDVESVRETLVDRGGDMRSVRQPAPGVRVADGFDPEGNVFSEILTS